MYDDELTTLRTDIWTHEVQVGGFGNGEFEWTTASEENSFVVDNKLIIMPTLTDKGTLDDNQISDGYVLNLTADGIVPRPMLTNVLLSPTQHQRLASVLFGRHDFP